MGLIKKLVGLAFLVLLLWGGYVVYAALTASPQFNARWGTVNEDVTNIIITGEWKKPLLIPIEVQKLAINFTGIEIAKVSEFKYNPTSTSATVVVSIDNNNLVKALINYLNNGQKGTAVISVNGKFLRAIPLNLNLKEEINEDILGQLNFTAESKEVLGGLARTPALVSTKVEWKGEEGNTGILVAHMKFYNPNDFPVAIGAISFDFYANGIKIGEGHTTKTIVVPGKGYATMPVETDINESALPEVWALHVRNGEESTLIINLYLMIKLSGREINVKLLSQKETVKTDIMGQLNKALDELSKEISRG